MDLAGYARFVAAMEGKQPDQTNAVLAAMGETPETLAHAKRTFDPRFGKDPKLDAEWTVRMMLAQNARARAELPPPAIARRVRAATCFRCGGHKRTQPRTAYVYCDYCGALFDYDDELAHARQDTGYADGTTFNALVDGVRAEVRRAFEAGDMAAYRAAWRWPFEMDMTLFPDGWSPRVRDPAYRAAMVTYSVETCVLQNTTEQDLTASQNMQRAYGVARSAPSEATFKAYVNALYADIAADNAWYKQHGIFDLHPDKLDEATSAHIYVVRSVLGWRTLLDEAHFEMLLKIAGIETARVDIAPVGIGQASCGQCGGKLMVVDDARTVVCEACGYELDGKSSFGCPTCGAQMLLGGSGQHATKCAWCANVVTVVT